MPEYEVTLVCDAMMVIRDHITAEDDAHAIAKAIAKNDWGDMPADELEPLDDWRQGHPEIQVWKLDERGFRDEEVTCDLKPLEAIDSGLQLEIADMKQFIETIARMQECSIDTTDDNLESTVATMNRLITDARKLLHP